MTSTLHRLFIATLFVSAVFLSTAEARPSQSSSPQTVDQDWVLTRLPEQKATLAVAAFDNGLALALRCVNGALDLTITGLPEAPGRATTRTLGLSADGSAQKDSVWTVATERGSAFSRVPAMVARQLAEGGAIQIVVPAEPGGRRTRYEMAMSSSSIAIEQVLTACDRPLVDPRVAEVEGNGQDGLPPALTWSRPPRVNFPESHLGVISEGYVVLSCLSRADGRAGDCQIESEQPQGYNLGRAVTRAISNARLQRTPEGIERGVELEGRLIVFTTNFRWN